MLSKSEKDEICRKPVKYPEHVKIIQIKEQAALLKKFISWASINRGFDLSLDTNIDNLIIEFFGISLEKLSEEKIRMLANIKIKARVREGNT